MSYYCLSLGQVGENCKGGQEFHVAVEIAVTVVMTITVEQPRKVTATNVCRSFFLSRVVALALVLEQLHVGTKYGSQPNNVHRLGMQVHKTHFFCGMYPTSCRVSRVHVSYLRPENQRLGRKLITAPGGKIVLITSKMGSMADNTSGGAYG